MKRTRGENVLPNGYSLIDVQHKMLQLLRTSEWSHLILYILPIRKCIHLIPMRSLSLSTTVSLHRKNILRVAALWSRSYKLSALEPWETIRTMAVVQMNLFVCSQTAWTFHFLKRRNFTLLYRSHSVKIFPRAEGRRVGELKKCLYYFTFWIFGGWRQLILRIRRNRNGNI